MVDEKKQPYAPPVNELLTYGDCHSIELGHDYLPLGFTKEHIPELIRMAMDKDLHWGDFESLEVWAPIHAWRVLGQLKAIEAAEPLIKLWHELDEIDWTDEIERILVQIGTETIPLLDVHLEDTSRETFDRIHAATTLRNMALEYPESRDRCVQIIVRELEKFQDNDPAFSAFLISNLADIKAIETAPLMEKAFRAKAVDTSIMGNWGDVEVEMGLKAKAAAYDFDVPMFNFFNPFPALSGLPYAKKRRADKRAKTKRKMAVASRKKNRRRKK